MPADISGKDAVSRALTVYNDGFALVKETRKLPEFPADGVLRYLDVAQRIETESILVEGLDIREMNYEYDLVDKNKLLEKYIGRELTIVDPESGKRSRYRLLSVANGMVVEDLETGEIVLDPKGQVRLPELPGGLILTPALVWHASRTTSDEVRVSYLTQGMSWETDYVIALPAETDGKETFSLTGWMTLRNESGMTYEDAVLRVLAGEVHRAEEPDRFILYSAVEERGMPEHESFADYHLYTIPGTVTIKDRQQKQVRLIGAEGAAGRTIYEIGPYDRNPAIYFEFGNTEAAGLGFPLPQGTVKFYRNNRTDGTAEFVGEDRIGHTAKGERVRLQLGQAFDITVDSGLTSSRKEGRYDLESYMYAIRNAKDVPVTVIIRHPVHERHWDIAESDHPAEREFGDVLIPVTVPAGKEETVRFTLRIDRSITIAGEEE
ncbi:MULTISPECIES: DUF4139 domain-containing protein [Bhargavaea]|uniref:DUF4139 domain-containing protein n=1 Tax=Bhargavaea changchunensis TaxID=2134037 RepID=A0ABW2NEI2_9BACL|nr:DUF4139 domain-containing protein [Bhargavaea sp. CC-171006]